jgi:hypothetical protein
MVSTYLDADYSVVDVAALLGDDSLTSWSGFPLDNPEEIKELSFVEVSENLFAITSPSGEVVEVGLDAAGNPTSFFDMPITKFERDRASGVASCPTCGIPTGEVEGFAVSELTDEEAADIANHDENGRFLKEFVNRELVGTAHGNDMKCLAEGAQSAYNTGNNHDQNAVAKTCGSRSVSCFQGTNPSSWRDIWADIKGVVDNFQQGWSNIVQKNIRDTYKNVCTGHSLGGAIAKVNARKGKCGGVVTFGAPYTGNHPGNVPITQVINTHKAGWPNCCRRSWGWCRNRDQYTADPVTNVGYIWGGHTNRYYINGGHRAQCWSSTIRSLASVGLHSMDNYVNAF